MKRRFLAILCAALCVLPVSACSFFAKSTVLAEPAKAEKLKLKEHNEAEFVAFKEKVNAFSAKFSAETFVAFDNGSNFSVSPVSVYMALGMAAVCANGQTQAEILSALGVNQTQLLQNYSKLYRSLNVEHLTRNVLNQERVLGKLQLSNSIWLDDALSTKQDCLDSLSNHFYSYAHQVDFDGKNKNANDAISNFVKKQTNGLIKRDFNIAPNTIFALINTLYLKDVWNYNGDDIARTSSALDFKNSDGSMSSERFLQGDYITGRAYETDEFSAYYTRTEHGYKIKFFLPKENYTVDDIFTADNLEIFNAVTDFDAEDEENLLRYHTRCLFPEHKSSFDGDVQDVLKQNFGISSLFDLDSCDFSNLTDSKPAYCSGVIHQTSLEVNRKGIEGAAVTAMLGAGAPGPDEYQDVYVDFLVNKAFGFILTDPYNTMIFAGVIHSI